MRYKTVKKIPPGIGQPGGKKGAKNGHVISYSNIITNPAEFQKIADTFDLLSERYRLLSEYTRNEAILLIAESHHESRQNE